MEFTHIDGKNKGKIMLYALSTCVWCKKTKRLLGELGIAYDYVFVDLLDDDEKANAKKELERWNPRGSFPTIVVNDKESIVGYDVQKIKELINNE
ncbi:MAG: glutaredoxin family protein [bacterium]